MGTCQVNFFMVTTVNEEPKFTWQFLRTNLGGIQPTTGIIGRRKVLNCERSSDVARG